MNTSTLAPLRIFLVIRRVAGRSGGAERVYIDLANILQELGHEVTCLHFDRSAKEPFFKLDPRVARRNLWRKGSVGIGFQELWAALFFFYERGRILAPAAWFAEHFLFFRGLWEEFKTRQPDVVISLMPAANNPSLLAGLMTGTKVIASNHNVPEQDYESDERWDQNPIDKAIRVPLLRTAHRVHVLFEAYRNWFPQDVQRRIEVIHNYPSSDVGPGRPFLERKPVVLAVGRLAGVKNYSVLIDAWALLADEFPEWTVEIYGSGPDEEPLRKQIERLDLSSRVLLKGHSSAVAEAYAQSSIFAHPSWFEGFPLVVIEALKCGLPVVGFSDTSGFNQLVFDQRNGLLVDREEGSRGLARALRRLLSERALRAVLAEAAPGSVAQYSKQEYVRRWQEVLASAVDQ